MDRRGQQQRIRMTVESACEEVLAAFRQVPRRVLMIKQAIRQLSPSVTLVERLRSTLRHQGRVTPVLP